MFVITGTGNICLCFNIIMLEALARGFFFVRGSLITMCTVGQCAGIPWNAGSERSALIRTGDTGFLKRWRRINKSKNSMENSRKVAKKERDLQVTKSRSCY